MVIETTSVRQTRGRSKPPTSRAAGESIVAISVIAAAALATFLALFLTSRPYDPMMSSSSPQQDIPQGPVIGQPSAKPSQTVTPASQPSQSPPSISQPTEEPANDVPDDASIHAQIEKKLTSDSSLSELDVSTMVENGKVTLVGSVQTADQKQRVEKAVRSVKGVLGVENQLVITSSTP